MMQYDMDLKWRKGTEDVALNALSRLRRKGRRGADINHSFLDDPTTAKAGQGPAGPVLDGVPLQDLAPSEDDDEGGQSGLSLEGKEEEQDGVTLDDVRLAALGATEVDGPVEGNLAVLYAL